MRDLRPHQQQALLALRESIRAGRRRPMVSAPTGAGKTRLAAAIVEGALAKGNRVLFVVPALSLIDQTVESFYVDGIRDVGVIQADHPLTDWSKRVQVASVQTLQRRGLPDATVGIVDEAHRWFEFYREWFGHGDWRDRVIIGLSATPWTKGLGKYYDDLLIAATTADLIEQGYLSPFRVFAPSHPDLSAVRTVAGDFHEGDLSEAMSPLVADVVETWLRRGENRSTLCFAVDRAHAKHLQARFEAAGVSTGYVDAYTDAFERERIRQRFHSGDIRVVCNVGCLTTGIDWDVRCLILARPTRSEMLYCLDAETEILTSHGWRGIGQVKPGDCAATLADLQTGRGQWARVTGVVEREMDASERWIEYHAPRANFRVTDHHTMIAAHAFDKKRTMRRMAASEMAALKGGVFMPTAVRMDQPGVPLTDAELYFIGMMMADGTWGPARGAISQSERHMEIVDRIERCLRDIGIYYSKKRVLASGGYTERYCRWVFTISAGKPRSNARKWGGHTGYRHLLPYMDKDLSPALMAMSKAQLDRLLQGLWDGDGSKKKGVDYIPRSIEICSARPELMDRLQALCAINGYTANVRKEHGPSRAKPIWLITITPKDWRSCGGYSTAGRGDRPQIETNPATQERVWCVETETGTIITRRRGKVTVMGNCQIIGRALRTAEGKDEALILDHSDTTLRLGFVTDIHHDRLDDGRERQKQETKPRESLPKECPKCSYLKPPKVSVCPACGFKPERQSNVEHEDGDLIEMDARGKARTNQEVGWDEKRSFLAQLRGYAAERGYASGWASHAFKDKFGCWPANQIANTPPDDCGMVVRNWVKSRQIARAKAMGKQRGAA